MPIKMKLLFCLFFLASLLISITDAVLYGQFISIKEAPYFVSMLLPGRKVNLHDCGGSIISEHWIITSAHCTALINNLVDDRITAGESIPDKSNISTYDVEKIFVHGDYVPIIGKAIDIALLKLKEPIVFDEYRQPIKIRKIPPRENDTVITMGFGKQGDAKGFTPVLRRTEVIVINDAICDLDVNSFGVRNLYFCAGNGTTDTCGGDSGGPAIINGELAGLVAFGPWCTNYKMHSRRPGKYARLDLFYDWIMKITGIVY